MLFYLLPSRSRLPGDLGDARARLIPSASRSRLPGGTLGGPQPGCRGPAVGPASGRDPWGRDRPGSPSPASRSRLPGGTLAATGPARRSRPAGGTYWVVRGGGGRVRPGNTGQRHDLDPAGDLAGLRWWQRGRIQRRDLWRVLPFVLIGIVMVVMEVFQQHAVAQQTVVRSDGLLSRTAVAGCAVWFYLWKAVWPVDLMFVYPRWNLAAVSAIWFAPACCWRRLSRWPGGGGVPGGGRC